MKIIGLKVDGIRKLTAVEMEFTDKGLIQIKGKNKQGKTSLIDTIQWIIEGNKKLNADIIQHGKEKAKAELQVGDYVIKRVTTRKSQSLEVRNIRTNKVEKGEVQNFLNTFVNDLTFNPRPFLDQTPLQQLKFAMDLFKIDFTELDRQLTALEQDRLICGREVKKFGDLDEGAPEEFKRVDIDALLKARKRIEQSNLEIRAEYEEARNKELAEIDKFNEEQRRRAAKIKTIQDTRKANDEEIYKTEEKIKELKRQLEQAESWLSGLQETKAELQKEFEELPQPLPLKPLAAEIPEPKYHSLESIDQQIAEANANNVKAEAYERWLEKKAEKREKENEYDALDGKIKRLREKKLETLRAVNTGVEGLEIREDGLYYNGVSSQNWSDSEAIRISSQLCIAQMPELRTIFIDRGESFDSESLKELELWAIENDIQAIITIVDSYLPTDIEEGVFYIEEGKVIKPSNGKATKKQLEEIKS